MTVNGFTYISAGCRLLREVVIDDMPTLSDRCVLVSLHKSLVFNGDAWLWVRHTLSPCRL